MSRVDEARIVFAAKTADKAVGTVVSFLLKKDGAGLAELVALYATLSLYREEVLRALEKIDPEIVAQMRALPVERPPVPLIDVEILPRAEGSR